MDPNMNHVYYWCPETNQTVWTLPADGVILAPELCGGAKEEEGEEEKETIDELMENYPYVNKKLEPKPGEDQYLSKSVANNNTKIFVCIADVFTS